LNGGSTIHLELVKSEIKNSQRIEEIITEKTLMLQKSDKRINEEVLKNEKLQELEKKIQKC